MGCLQHCRTDQEKNDTELRQSSFGILCKNLPKFYVTHLIGRFWLLQEEKSKMVCPTGLNTKHLPFFLLPKVVQIYHEYMYLFLLMGKTENFVIKIIGVCFCSAKMNMNYWEETDANSLYKCSVAFTAVFKRHFSNYGMLVSLCSVLYVKTWPWRWG